MSLSERSPSCLPTSTARRRCFGCAVPFVGELGDRPAELRHDFAAGIAAQITAARPGTNPEQVEAFANAITGVGEQMGRWWMRNRHVPRSRVVTHYTDFISNGLQQLQDE